ncbi:MAG TPA: CPBP family intramembrane glutamic endopeptidase [Mycobacteriales bacterium]|nr:CPBP family intramembrane glutamic endopeptidase [Mycobacteriales bacterium]
MTSSARAVTTSVATPGILVGGAAAALGLRVVIGGRPAGVSPAAALVFAAALVALAVAAGWRPGRTSMGRVAGGVLGGAVLCIPSMITRMSGPGHGGAPWRDFLGWALVVAAVAVAEEVLLRGALYDHLVTVGGDALAIGVGALLFAALHVPLYGAHAVILDLAVGVWLGALRLATGGVAAPAAAHTVADWAAWWLR